MTMLQRLWWTGLAGLLGLAWIAASDLSSVESAGEDAPAVSSDAVRVTYELVSAPLVRELPAPVAKSARVTRLPTPRVQAREPVARPEGVTARAMRMLLGDGTHRPQPFPTIK
jgi:hypothetical protein